MPSEYRYVLPDLGSRFAAVVDFVCPLGRGLFSGPEPLAALQKSARVNARYTVKEAISEITAGSTVGDNGEAFSGRRRTNCNNTAARREGPALVQSPPTAVNGP